MVHIAIAGGRLPLPRATSASHAHRDVFVPSARRPPPPRPWASPRSSVHAANKTPVETERTACEIDTKMVRTCEGPREEATAMGRRQLAAQRHAARVHSARSESHWSCLKIGLSFRVCVVAGEEPDRHAKYLVALTQQRVVRPTPRERARRFRRVSTSCTPRVMPAACNGRSSTHTQRSSCSLSRSPHAVARRVHVPSMDCFLVHLAVKARAEKKPRKSQRPFACLSLRRPRGTR